MDTSFLYIRLIRLVETTRAERGSEPFCVSNRATTERVYPMPVKKGTPISFLISPRPKPRPLPKVKNAFININLI